MLNSRNILTTKCHLFQSFIFFVIIIIIIIIKIIKTTTTTTIIIIIIIIIMFFINHALKFKYIPGPFQV